MSTGNGQATGERFRAADVAAGFAEAPEPVLRGETLADALRSLIDKVKRGEPVLRALECGIALIDQAGGLVRGEFWGLAAPPKVGKSLLSDAVALGVLRRNPEARAIVFNAETRTPIRTARLLAGECIETFGSTITSWVPLTPLVRGSLRERGVECAELRAGELAAEVGERLRFIDNARDAAEAAAIIHEERPDFVVVDHLGLLVSGRTGNAVADFDAALGVLVESLRETDAAGWFINETNKLGASGDADGLAATRGSARFASIAGAFCTLGFVAFAEEGKHGERAVQLDLWTNRNGPGYTQERGTLHGGLGSIRMTGKVERMKPPEPKKPKGAKKQADDA